MNYCKDMLSSCVFLNIIIVLLVTAVAGISPSFADNSDISGARPGNISASGNDTVGSAREKALVNPSATTKSFADRDEKNASSMKTQPKTKRIIIGAIMITILAFIIINIVSASNNLRICSKCGYTGTMKAVTLTDKPLVNSLLVALVTVFPVLLYYYSERGRFLCPICRRTSTNVSMRSKLRDMNW